MKAQATLKDYTPFIIFAAIVLALLLFYAANKFGLLT